ncbi:hypothetical protein MA16_Dca012115 [Dendrobium catenatum]|uniref:Uncharacterized protein n=1 Tax=Dendrobium catenatum TaxID=906689 RepID=A0A2I0VF06_9ASPA|nr:hypothetical protein MA16_Dca012115 [Dendrobium catenatum]
MDLRPFFLALVLLFAATGKIRCTAKEFHSRFSVSSDSTSVFQRGRIPPTPPPPRPNSSHSHPCLHPCRGGRLK